MVLHILWGTFLLFQFINARCRDLIHEVYINMLQVFIAYMYIHIFLMSYAFLQNAFTYFVGGLLLCLNVLTQATGTLLMRYKILVFLVLGGDLYILWASAFLYQCANTSCKDIIYGD